MQVVETILLCIGGGSVGAFGLARWRRDRFFFGAREPRTHATRQYRVFSILHSFFLSLEFQPVARKK